MVRQYVRIALGLSFLLSTVLMAMLILAALSLANNGIYGGVWTMISGLEYLYLAVSVIGLACALLGSDSAVSFAALFHALFTIAFALESTGAWIVVPILIGLVEAFVSFFLIEHVKAERRAA